MEAPAEADVAVAIGDIAAPAAQAALLPHHRAALSWEGLSVSVKDTKGATRDILKDAVGYVPAGHFCAVMGPSGCGKSTLLDSLSGRLAGSAALTGSVMVNGHATQLSYGRAAFVTQDEVLLGVLSVRETIQYAARLRLLPTHEPSPAAVAEAVIQELGLSECADTIIGTWYQRGVSGGQRRRVAIGCELVVSPTLLFLDEPTSGLDSAAAYHVTAVLRRLASGGRTVLAVIHQPASEVFEQFDLLAMLAAGSTLYFGAAAGAAPFFEATLGYGCPVGRSAPDHLLHAVNADFGDADAVTKHVAALVAAYGGSPAGAALATELEQVKAAPGERFEAQQQPPGAVRQTAVLTHRAFTVNLRDLGIFWMRIAMYIGLCLMIGFIYFRMKKDWQDVFPRVALMWFVVAFLTFMSIAAFPSFVEDMKVFTRERLNGYYPIGTFVVSNTLASLPFIFLIAFTSAISVYFISGLNIGGTVAGERFIYFVLEVFAALVTVESMMTAIAPLVPHFLMGIAAGAGILGMFMVVTGFVQLTDQLPKPILRYPLHYMSFQTYAWYGLMHNEFDGTTGWGCPCSAQPGGCAPSQGGAACSITGADILKYWSVPADYEKWGYGFGILFAWTFFFRLLFYVACAYKERKARG